MTGYEATARTEVAAPPERVWEAMTDPDQVAEYMMGSRVESDWRPGSQITWSGEWEGRPYQDKGEVLEAEPGRRLVVTHYSPLTGQEDVPESYRAHTRRRRDHARAHPGRLRQRGAGEAVLAELAGHARRAEEGGRGRLMRP